jgi:hypothetical protein
MHNPALQAQLPLEEFVMVRIHVGQPILPTAKTT